MAMKVVRKWFRSAPKPSPTEGPVYVLKLRSPPQPFEEADESDVHFTSWQKRAVGNNVIVFTIVVVLLIGVAVCFAFGKSSKSKVTTLHYDRLTGFLVSKRVTAAVKYTEIKRTISIVVYHRRLGEEDDGLSTPAMHAQFVLRGYRSECRWFAVPLPPDTTGPAKIYLWRPDDQCLWFISTLQEEPLQQCFFSCGFLKYGKYHDGSVCWYFSRIGQVFATTGHCSQGICLKLFTGGYNGSDAQKYCGNIPRNASWLQNNTMSTKGPVFNVSDATQHRPIESYNTSTAVSPSHSFQTRDNTTMLSPTTAADNTSSKLPPGTVPATKIDRFLLSTTTMPPQVTAHTEKVSSETASVSWEPGASNASGNDSSWHKSTTKIPVEAFTFTTIKPENTTIATVATTEGNRLSSQVATALYPESSLNTTGRRPSVAATEDNTANSTVKTLTEVKGGESTAFPSGTSVPITTEIYGSTTIPPIHFKNTPPPDTAHASEVTANKSSQKPQAEKLVVVTPPSLTDKPLRTDMGGASTPVVPAAGVYGSLLGTNEQTEPSTKILVSVANPAITKVPSNLTHAKQDLTETATKNVTIILKETSATGKENKSIVALQPVVEIPSPAIIFAGDNATENATESPYSLPKITSGPPLKSTTEQPQTNTTTGFISSTDTDRETRPALETPSTGSEIFNATEPHKYVTEPLTTLSPLTAPFTQMRPLSGITDTAAAPSDSKTALGVPEATGDDSYSSTKTPIPTETHHTYSVVTGAPQRLPLRQTSAAIAVLTTTRRPHASSSVTGEQMIGNTSEASVTALVTSRPSVADVLTTKPLYSEISVTSASPNISVPPSALKDVISLVTTAPLTRNPKAWLQNESVTMVNEAATTHVYKAPYQRPTIATTTLYPAAPLENYTTPGALLPSEMPLTSTGTTLPKNATVETTTAQPTSTSTATILTTTLASEVSFPGSESGNVNDTPFLPSENLTGASRTTTPSTLVITHQNETVKITTDNITSTDKAVPVTEKPIEVEITPTSLESPEITVTTKITPAYLAPVTSAPRASTTPTSNLDFFDSTTTLQTNDTGNLYLDNTDTKGSSTRPASVERKNKTDSALTVSTETKTTSTNFSDQTSMPVSATSSEKPALMANESSLSATVPFVKAMEDRKPEAEINSSSTKEYKGRSNTTTQLSYAGLGNVTTGQVIQSTHNATYAPEKSLTTPTFTQESAIVSESATTHRTTSRSNILVTAKTTKRSKSSSSAPILSLYLFLGAIATIIFL